MCASDLARAHSPFSHRGVEQALSMSWPQSCTWLVDTDDGFSSFFLIEIFDPGSVDLILCLCLLPKVRSSGGSMCFFLRFVATEPGP